jgi:ATP-dependent Clp protease ATP-binding subunit ClpX
VPPAGGYELPAQPGTPFDTQNVLFICGGAFVGLEEIITGRLGRAGFGFEQASNGTQVAGDRLLHQVRPEDLEAFGLIPGIVGLLLGVRPVKCIYQVVDWPGMMFGAPS